MDFSEAFSSSSCPAAFSPDGKHVASAEEYRLVVRNVDSLQIVQLYPCLDRISQIEWCCHSRHLLCALHQRHIVQVWSLEDPEWTCKIDEGSAGVAHARWSPDGLHILVTADFQLRITIWSLVTKACIHINGPKLSARGLAFSPDGSVMALAERYDCKDYVSLYATKGWRPLLHVHVPTQDLEDLAWAPDGTCLCVWDTPLDYQVLVLGLDGAALGCFSAYGNALGVKSVAWAPSGRFLAVGSYDQEVRLLNHANWEPLAQLSHPTRVTEPPHLVAYQEVEHPLAPAGGACLEPSAAAGPAGLPQGVPQGVAPEVRSPRDPAAGPASGASCRLIRVQGGLPTKSAPTTPTKASSGAQRAFSRDAGNKAPPTSARPAWGLPGKAPGTAKAGGARGGGEKKPRSLPSSPKAGARPGAVPPSPRGAPRGPSRLLEPPAAASVAQKALMRSRYELCTLPLRLPYVKPALDKPNPKLGVGKLAWSADGQFLASRSDAIAPTVWIWDAARMQLAALLQQASGVRDFAWDPRRPRLAITTGGQRVFMWTPQGASCIHVPLPAFSAASVAWNPDGQSLLLAEKGAFCVAYLDGEEEAGAGAGGEGEEGGHGQGQGLEGGEPLAAAVGPEHG